MKINKAFKFRIYPNKEQRILFAKTFGCTRFIYNQMLAERIEVYEKLKDDKKMLYAHKYKTEANYKKEFEFLKEVDSIALQQSRRDLDTAYKNFFKSGFGFPKFKSKKISTDSYRTQSVNGNLKVNFHDKRISLPKIGKVRFRDKRIFDNKINSMTLSKNKGGRYYVSILTEYDFEPNLPKEIREDKVFSADMSCKDFLVSQEMVFENQKHYRKNERRLKIRQRRLSKKQKGSINREEERLNVARTHEKIVNARRGYQRNLAHELINKFDAFCFEDLNMEGMKKFNKGISKTVTLDFSFSEFLTYLEWKCFKHNKHLVKIGRFFPSSKLCFNCGQVKNDLKLSDRTYICDCGYTEDRDINASKNIKREGINILNKKGINLLKNSTALMAESYACGDMSEDVNNSAQESTPFRTW